jgi:hypothetical protein
MKTKETMQPPVKPTYSTLEEIFNSGTSGTSYGTQIVASNQTLIDSFLAQSTNQDKQSFVKFVIQPLLAFSREFDKNDVFKFLKPLDIIDNQSVTEMFDTFILIFAPKLEQLNPLIYDTPTWRIKK